MSGYDFDLYSHNLCDNFTLHPNQKIRVPLWSFTSTSTLYNVTYLYTPQVREDGCFGLQLNVFNNLTTGV